MSAASSDIKSAKRPGQSGTPIMVRLQPAELIALDAARGDLTRPAAIRAILQKVLK
ncbi:MAG: hypothetical protein Q8S53_09600 [Brevundimonas sp.]|uniref:hypothetical protein n=1 Tax=Brevundimonas sp. TaxID=1871086 RepID=UPI00273642A4|nr:hypothetical protein [Brevundimonas sp.]MDP3378609.1 hypothetical protein [Brevundimonas sp.]